MAAAGGCAAQTATTSVTIIALPTATISYAGTPFCKSLVVAQSVTRTGTGGGTYTAAPAGLTINAVTGAITPSSSTAGTYTVTYTLYRRWMQQYSNHFSYDYNITCSYDQLCRHTILYITCRCAVCNTDGHSGRNVYSCTCRINDQCSDRSDHTEFKYSRNIYGYLYDGRRRRMCCTDSNDIGDDNNITSSYDQLCRHTILFITGWCAVCNPDGHSRRNIYSGTCRTDDQCRYRSNHTEQQYSRNIYGYLYDGSCRRMCCTDSDYISDGNNITCSYDQLCRHTILFITCRCAVCNTDRHSRWNIYSRTCRINY